MAIEGRGAALLPALALLLNACTWGLSWWPFRQLELRGLHPLWATVLIYLLAVVAISLARPRAWGQLLSAPVLWVLVLASGTTNAAFNWAVTIGDVVRVVLLFYLMPLWAVVLARLLLAEPVTAAAARRLVLALAGAAIVLWPQGGALQPPGLTDVLGLVGGFSFALNNVMLRRESRRPPEARALAMFLGGAVVAAALAAARGVALPAAAGAGWILGALAMGAAFLAGNMALQFGAARLPANVTAVVMVSEVLFASVSALLLGAGTLSASLVIGGALIVAATLLAATGTAPARAGPAA